jgi:hypothetical protein
MKFIEWDDRDNEDNGDNKGSVECVPAKDIEVNELGVWLPGRLLNISLTICKRIEACLPLILLFGESLR